MFDDLTITDGMCETAGSLSNRVLADRGVSAPLFGPRADISALANDYMNQISYQVDVSPSVESLASSVSRIVSQAGSSVGTLEAAAVATTGSIAVNSAGYWTSTEGTATAGGATPYSRASLGIDATDDLTVRFMIGLSPRAKTIIKADVAAAAAVLLREWFMGEAAIAKACITAAAASLIAGIFAT